MSCRELILLAMSNVEGTSCQLLKGLHFFFLPEQQLVLSGELKLCSFLKKKINLKKAGSESKKQKIDRFDHQKYSLCALIQEYNSKNLRDIAYK